MRILEIYDTVQGEGMDIGRQAIFVRTAGCSVGCVWCDTKESWAFGKEFERNVGELADEIIALSKKTGIKSVVFTGGEPMQQPDHDIFTFFRALTWKGIDHIAVETSGIKVPGMDIAPLARLWTVSPKLSSAQPKVKCDADKMREWIYSVGKVANLQFKFVIADTRDLREVVAMLRDVRELKTSQIPVVFQPEESVAQKVYQKLSLEWLQDYFPDRNDFNLRLIPQVHKMMNLP